MNSTPHRTLAQRSAALVLAVIVTLALLDGIDRLATRAASSDGPLARLQASSMMQS